MDLKILLWAGAGLQLVMAGANFVIPGRLDFRGNLSRVSPIIRQVFRVHHAYIVWIIVFFASLCFLFPAELAGASPLGRFLCGFIALFWLARVPIQLFYYDPELRRRNRLEDVLVTLLLASLAGIFGLVFLRGRP